MKKGKRTATILGALVATTTCRAQDRGCVDSVAPGADLFPIKVAPTNSQFWDIEYFGTYKIVTNKKFSLTYLLYQCGTQVPADQQDGRHEAIVEIPLTDVAISATPMISYMEQLEALDRISTFLSDSAYVASPCFAKAIQSGEVTSLNRGNAEEGLNPSLEGLNPPNETKLTTFVTGYQQSSESSRPPFSNTIIAVSEDEESTNDAIFEWVKYFAVFFNLEEVANEVFDKAEERLKCVAENAGKTSTDSGAKPKLLWAYYSGYCGGWDVGECPNYYCEYAEACNAELMASSEGTNQAAMETCGATYMTDDEFFAHAKDADFWFFPSFNWNETATMYADRLNEIKAYREKKVYDYMGRGPNGWFEQRFAEYYKVVEDVCVTLGVKQSLTGRHFWRDVFTEQVPPSGVDATCDESSSSSILDDPDTCVPIEENTLNPSGTSTNAAHSAVFGLIVMAAAYMLR